MIRVAIVEDEVPCAKELERQLRCFETENGVVFEIAMFRSAIELVEDYRPVYDILFLDVEMPVLDGISAAQQIRIVDPQVMIMFVTYASKYAVRSYEVQAVDYVLKPLRYPAFALKLKRIIRELKAKDQRFLLLQSQNAISRIAIGDIYYVEVADHMLTYHTATGAISAKGTMRSLEAQLSEEGFSRCNNCYLINLAYFQELRDDLAIVQGQTLKISRNRRKAFVDDLMRYQRGDLSLNC